MATHPLRENELQCTALPFGQFFHLFNGQPEPILSEDAHHSASRNGFFTSSLPYLTLDQHRASGVRLYICTGLSDQPNDGVGVIAESCAFCISRALGENP